MAVNHFPQDSYTEPNPVDVNTLANLGPLRALAGVWRGVEGLDVKPKLEGPRQQTYVAVSYTHLDVYKRQSITWTASARPRSTPRWK